MMTGLAQAQSNRAKGTWDKPTETVSQGKFFLPEGDYLRFFATVTKTPPPPPGQ
jgi:hypothetical protein